MNLSRIAELARKLADQKEQLSASEASELLRFLIDRFGGKISDTAVGNWQAAMIR